MIDAAEEGGQLGDRGFEGWFIVRASSAPRLIVSTFAGGAFVHTAYSGLAPVGETNVWSGAERLLGLRKTPIYGCVKPICVKPIC